MSSEGGVCLTLLLAAWAGGMAHNRQALLALNEHTYTHIADDTQSICQGSWVHNFCKSHPGGMKADVASVIQHIDCRACTERLVDVIVQEKEVSIAGTPVEFGVEGGRVVARWDVNEGFMTAIVKFIENPHHFVTPPPVTVCDCWRMLNEVLEEKDLVMYMGGEHGDIEHLVDILQAGKGEATANDEIEDIYVNTMESLIDAQDRDGIWDAAMRQILAMPGRVLVRRPTTHNESPQSWEFKWGELQEVQKNVLLYITRSVLADGIWSEACSDKISQWYARQMRFITTLSGVMGPQYSKGLEGGLHSRGTISLRYVMKLQASIRRLVACVMKECCDSHQRELDLCGSRDDARGRLILLALECVVDQMIKYMRAWVVAQQLLGGESNPVQKKKARKKKRGKNETAPLFEDEDFMCPITHRKMKDPVIARDGFTYSREAITQWFVDHPLVSPVTGERVASNDVIPDLFLMEHIAT